MAIKNPRVEFGSFESDDERTASQFSPAEVAGTTTLGTLVGYAVGGQRGAFVDGALGLGFGLLVQVAK